jgi:P27 family predicted phage terminase small subunit
MPGPAPKPPDQRQGRHRRDVGLVALDGKVRVAPQPSTAWLKPTKDHWAAFWTSPMAQLVVLQSDSAAIGRLFDLYDDRERCRNAAKGKWLVTGSTGQPVLNPILKRADDLEEKIRSLEAQFGMTPYARLKLGATFGEASRSLDALNRTLLEGLDDDADTEQEAQDDPRLTVVSPKAG